MYPNLKLQLWKSGIRQNRLARLVGVDETVLSRIVNGYREPPPALQKNIAEILKCEAAWLFDRQNEAGAPASTLPMQSPKSEVTMDPATIYPSPLPEPESGQAE